MAVIAQQKNLKRWKDKMEYGKRWNAESGFSSFKRMFGENIRAHKPENMIRELLLKVRIYNMLVLAP